MQLTGPITIRPLTAADRESYRHAVESGMSDTSRYLRFASPIPRLTERQLDYLTDIDGEQHVALVAVDGDEALGVARYVVSGPGEAEVAIGVGDAWQGRGVGTALMQALVLHASARGITTLRATTLAENRGARALLKSAGFRATGSSGAMVDYLR